MTSVFVIRPFGTKSRINFDAVHEALIGPAIEAIDASGGTTGSIVDSGNIREDMFQMILEADIVIADITIHNANVFYELGVRHALRKRRTVLLKGGGRVTDEDGTVHTLGDKTPFDVLTDRYLYYEVHSQERSLEALRKTLRSTLLSDRHSDSPVFALLPHLRELDPEDINILPREFSEVVERAVSSRARGWLNLLVDEVRDKRWRWQALRALGRAQYEVGDYVGSTKTWSQILEVYPRDPQANLAIAVTEQMGGHWTRSDQALNRVLDDGLANENQRMRAMTLKGRALRERWMQGLIDQPDAPVLSADLFEAHRAYLDAFESDLNAYHPGLRALQLGVILQSLAENDPDGWIDYYDSDREARHALEDLEVRMESLKHCVGEAIRREDRATPRRPVRRRVRVDLSKAEFMLITGMRLKRVLSEFREALRNEKAWKAEPLRERVELLVRLDVLPELAKGVAAAIAERFPVQPKRRRQIVLFCGHRIDGPNRAVPRFPAVAEEAAREAIIRRLRELRAEAEARGLELHGLAGGARGGDILFHEACEEMDIPSTICLPMPSDAFVATSIEMDEWRARFLDALRNRDLMVLSKQEKLPRWLGLTDDNALWVRGARWLIENALASPDVEKAALIALWDQLEENQAPGGTADIVRMARETGRMYVHVIPTAELPQMMVQQIPEGWNP